MTWLEMDVLDLDFGDGEFDLVVDKGKLVISRGHNTYVLRANDYLGTME